MFAIFPDSKIFQKNIKLTEIFYKLFYTRFAIDFQEVKSLFKQIWISSLSMFQ